MRITRRTMTYSARWGINFGQWPNIAGTSSAAAVDDLERPFRDARGPPNSISSAVDPLLLAVDPGDSTEPPWEPKGQVVFRPTIGHDRGKRRNGGTCAWSGCEPAACDFIPKRGSPSKTGDSLLGVGSAKASVHLPGDSRR